MFNNSPIHILFQSLVLPEKFQHILRILNTNIDGKQKIMFAVTSIKGVGRRYANVVLKKADIDLTKRAGELSEEEVMSCGTFFHYSYTNWHLLCITGGEIDNNHGKSTSVQDP